MMTTKAKWPCFFSFPKSILQAGIPLIFLLFSSVVNAADRPKVGLVLGGGGAAGVAHVGVLKVLEEQNIPIDYIAGTSMGAIVAGLYASGMSANELEQAVYSLDWLALFDDKQPLNQQGFHQKRLNSGFFSVGKLGVKEGTLLAPSGLVSGQKLLFELRRLFRPVAHINNFDQLKIPFRAVATDIETGQQVVLKQGNIAQAIRASMSIPGMFSPVRVGDKLLVDGFVANNVPVDVARDMGADILIVVNIPTFLEQKDKLGSAVDISLQAMQLMMLKTSAPQIKTLSRNDILIEPGTKDIGSLSFDRVRETIPLGIKAARAQLPALKRLSQTAGLTTNTQAKPASPDLLSARISAIKLHNESILNDRILLQRLGIKTGETLNADRLQRGLDAIHGLGHFDLVDYSLADDGKGGTILSINTHKRSTGNRHVHFGASLADNLEGDTSYQFGVKYIRSDINDQGAEWSNSLIFGDSIQLESQFYQPIPSQNVFLDATASYQEQDFFFFEGEERTSEFRGKQSDISLDIGKELGNWGEARVGAYYSYLEPDEKTGSTNFPDDTSFTSAGVRAQFNINTTDDDLLPSFGERLNVTYTHGSEALGSDTDFGTLEIRGSKVWSKDKHRFIVGGELGTTFEDESSPNEQLSLGGLGRLSGLARNQLRGNHLVLGSAVYMHELADIPAIKGAVYAGASLELGNVWQAADNIDTSDLLATGSAFVGADTPLGLAYFGVAQTEGFDIQPFLYLGQGF